MTKKYIKHELKLLSDVNDCFGFDFGNGYGVYVEVVDYGEGKEYFIEKNELIDGAFEPCDHNNYSCEFGNVDECLEIIEELIG